MCSPLSFLYMLLSVFFCFFTLFLHIPSLLLRRVNNKIVFLFATAWIKFHVPQFPIEFVGGPAITFFRSNPNPKGLAVAFFLFLAPCFFLTKIFSGFCFCFITAFFFFLVTTHCRKNCKIPEITIREVCFLF